jgi:cystathionine beta-lyase
VGRVWSREELTRVGEICLKHGVLVVADEIHADLIYKGITIHALCRHRRCPGPKHGGLHGAQQNLQPGRPAHLQYHHPQPHGCRRRFQRTLKSCGMGKWANPFGVLACETAYREGEDWLEQVMTYIEDNLDYLQDFIDNQIPGIRVIRPEGTYLVWLDCRGLGLDKWGLKRLMLEKSRIFPDEGFIFGPEGDGFERINIACPRSILNDALARIRRAVDSL